MDLVGLVSSYFYAFSLLFLVEWMGKKLDWSLDTTRKLIHIGAGLWVWGIILLFDHWYWGSVPFFTFIFLNYYFYKKETFQQMDDTHSTPGTVYFAVSITILFCLLWRNDAHDYVHIAVAATMAMTLGDAFAGIIGKRYGKKKFSVFGAEKSWLGTAAMAIFSFIGIYFAFYVLNTMRPVINDLFYVALAGTFFATLAEAVSPGGTDNLSVPLITGAFLYLLLR